MKRKYCHMSSYINIEKYNKFEKKHPFYLDMTKEMMGHLKRLCSRGKQRLLEVGAGTGHFSVQITKLRNCKKVFLEYDPLCLNLLNKLIPKYEDIQIIKKNAVSCIKRKYFNIIVSSFFDHHIPDNLKKKYYINIKNNLVKGGYFIVGDEFIPEYDDQNKRIISLIKYHMYIIKLILMNRNYDLAELELQSLIAGIKEKGEYKISFSFYNKLLKSCGFKMVSAKKIGPDQPNNVGGVYVFLFRSQ